MECRCRSYNNPQPNQDVEERVVEFPFPHVYKPGKMVCLDECIADTIIFLWDHGVPTAGCCCGHNHSKPSVALLNSNTPNDEISKVFSLIDDSGDKRVWEVCSYMLTKRIGTKEGFSTEALAV